MNEITADRVKIGFSRAGNGQVKIEVYSHHYESSQGDIVEEEVILSPHEWASIIANMSYYGEEDYGYYRALEFHTKIKQDPIVTPIRDKPVPENW